MAHYGFTIKKEVHFKGELQQLSTELHDLMEISHGTFATVMYQLIAQKGEQSLPYCTIIEVYSPDFLSISDLNYIYPDSQKDPHQK